MINFTTQRFKRNLKKKPTSFKLRPRPKHARKPSGVFLKTTQASPVGTLRERFVGAPYKVEAEVKMHPEAGHSNSTGFTLNPPTMGQLKLYKFTASHEEFCLMAFKKTKNNTYCTISRLFGLQHTLWTISGGYASGSKVNGRRKTRFTQRMVLKYAFEKLLGLGFKYLVIHCSGSAISKRYLFKNFTKRFKIVLLKDLTGVPHNGCRASNVRRK